jgi:hypothetical protein
MQKTWKTRNVDLALLTDSIENFFKQKDFEVVKEENEKSYQIFAVYSPYFKISGCISVTIEGKTDEITIKFELTAGKEKTSYLPSMLVTMLGGGYFLLQQFKVEEDLIRLEKEFWRYAENAVSFLDDSAQSFTSQSE